MPLVDLATAPSAAEKFKARVAYGMPKAYPLAINGLLGFGDDPSPGDFSGSDDIPNSRAAKAYVEKWIKKLPNDSNMTTSQYAVIADAYKNKDYYRAAGWIRYYLQKRAEQPLWGWSKGHIIASNKPRGSKMAGADESIYGSTGYPGPGYPTGMGALGCGCGCKKCGTSGLGADALDCNSVCASGWGGGGDIDWELCNCSATATWPKKNAPSSNDQFINRGNAVVGWAQQLTAPIFAAKANKPPKQVTRVQQTPDYTTLAVIGGGVVLFSVLMLAIAKKKG